ncbi:MAG: glycosyltransferase [Acidobacteria bacterium]|nr:glycosyltransferase [Acidobacteriota bacterium]
MTRVQRVALLSLHSSPTEQPGGGDAGGMNVYVLSLAENLARLGITVEIFTRATSENQPAAHPLGERITVHHVRGGPTRRVPKEILPALLPELTESIHQVLENLPGRPVNLLHSHYWLSGMVGLELAQRHHMPLVHTMHTMAKVKNHHRADAHAAEPDARSAGETRIVHEATRLIANTPAEALEMERHYNGFLDRIDVVAPGVDLDVFSPAFRASSRAGCHVATSAFHVVFAGRLQPLKGPHVLIAAAALLADQRPDIPLDLTLIGSKSGAEDYDLAALISHHGLSEHAVIMDPVEAKVLADWFRCADVVAMPSSSESFGLVALEAQACGTPVLATDVGGLPRAISNGRTGLLLADRDPQRWADALAALHDSPQTRADLGRAASIYVQRFSWEDTALGTMASYNRALSLPRE